MRRIRIRSAEAREGLLTARHIVPRQDSPCASVSAEELSTREVL